LEGLFVCPTCDGPLQYTGISAETLTLQLPTKQSRVTFSKVAIPYTMKLIDQEMTGIGNFGFRIITENTVGRLRESDWDWPEGSATLVDDAREEAPLAEKPKRKEGTDESSSEVVPEGEAAINVQGVQFGVKIQNEYIGFTTFASSPFRITGKQIPAPDGTNFPEFGAENPAQQTWPTVEHYYQAMKFPQDPTWQEEIRLAPTPAKAKKMGLDREHPVRGDWDKIKERIMKAALLEKFRQNSGLLLLLQKTGTRPLIDVTAGDPYWGSGSKGKGLNRLGALLQEVREELRDIRPDEALLAAPADFAPVAEENDPANEGPANFVDEAQQIVANATDGIVQMNGTVAPPEDTSRDQVQVGGGGGGVAPKVGQQPIYMFINPSMGGDHKAVRARQGGRGQVSWAGMAGGGGGGGGAPETLTADTEASGPKEVVVEKEG
jgi:ribA/ribD-fused uncharacterized protein